MATALRRVRTVFSGVAGTPYYSNLFFDGTGVTGAQQHALVVTFWDNLKTAIHEQIDWVVEGQMAVIDTATGTLTGFNAVPSVSGGGTATGDALPPATQGLIQWFTSEVVAGRLLRGRCFIPPASELLNVGGRPAPSYPEALRFAAQNLIDDSNVAGNLQVWSKTHGVSHDVITAAGWDQWAVLRSRRD